MISGKPRVNLRALHSPIRVPFRITGDISTMKKIFLVSLLASTALLGACVKEIPMLERENAQRIAMPVFMIPRTVNANAFRIKIYERAHAKHQPATIYIEGDGYLFSTGPNAINDITPDDPIALRLAAVDASPNVMYLGRPCQYNLGLADGKSCPDSYKQEKRFSKEVVEAYSAILDNIKGTYDISGFNLVGYDGGAAIAALLAAQRTDVLSLRSVAGNLNLVAASNIYGQLPMVESLNPVDYASQLEKVPQHHFLGKKDRQMIPPIYNSYAQAMVDGQCLNVTLVENADHERGWVEQWRELLKYPVTCNAPVEPQPVPFDPSSLDGDKGMGPK